MASGRRKKTDRRDDERRFDERRRMGIGEIVPEQRVKARRVSVRRLKRNRRNSPEEPELVQEKK